MPSIVNTRPPVYAPFERNVKRKPAVIAWHLAKFRLCTVITINLVLSTYGQWIPRPSCRSVRELLVRIKLQIFKAPPAT